MKRIKVYDPTDKHDLMKMVDMQKLGTVDGSVELLKSLTVYDLYIAASSNPHFLEVLENLGVEARKYLELQAKETGKLAMEAAREHIEGASK